MPIFNLDTTLILGYIFYLLVIIVHILIIRKIIPYHLVNGGRSKSYTEQASISKMSIVISFLGILFLSISLIKPSISQTLIYSIIGFLLTLYWILGFVMQLLGTKFERYLMSIIVLLGILSHLSLALLYFG
jgi:hypothetical protein